MATSDRLCSSCQNVLAANAKFCPLCGTPASDGASPASDGASPASPVPPPASPEASADVTAFRDRLQRALGPSLELRGALGRGGFAEVFVAWDTRLKRELAVKTVRPDLGTSKELSERFQREAEAVAMLRHPHIIPIYNVGEGDGVAYFTMPRIVGETLSSVLHREGSIDGPLACRIISEVASALETAHRAGVIHRDVKPDNIMLEGADQRAIVMDFGIARTGPATQRGLTGTGMFVGTPDYMSPEQASGERELDGRTDQYSLALVAYRMLSGVRAFESDSQQSSLYKQATTVPPLITERNPDVPTEVAEAVRRALSYDPAARFPSIGEFGAALARGMGAATVAAQGIQRREKDLPSRQRAMREAIPRLRHPLVAAGVAGIVAFAALLPATRTVPGYEYGIQDEAAWLASRDWLIAQGVAQPKRIYSDLEVSQFDYAFMQRVIGRRRADSLFRAVGLGWEWRSHFRDTAGTVWRVDMGPRQQVAGFLHTVPDTLSRKSLAEADAKTLATAAMRGFGIDPARLAFVGDSAIARAGRTDHFLTWRSLDGALPGLKGDSVTHRVRVTVQGDRVERMHRFLDISAASRTAFERPKWIGWMRAVKPFMVLGMAVLALVVVLARQRTDTLQWIPAARLLAAAMLLAAPLVLVDAWRTVVLAPDPTASALSGLAGMLLSAALGGGAVLCLLVAAESLSAEKSPQSFQGMRDVAHGRLLVPEIAVAAARGALAAAALLGLTTLIKYVGIRWFGAAVSAGVSDFLEHQVFAILMLFAIALPAVAGMMFGVSLLQRRRLPWWAACAIIGILGAMLLETGSMRHGSMVLGTVITAGGMAAIAWHEGFLASWVATILMLIAPSLLAVATTEGAESHATSLALGLVLVALPLALGFLAWRRATGTTARSTSPVMSQ